MQTGFTVPHAFSVGSIRAHAPAASGVFGLSNGTEWIYIGEADNIQQRLLELLAGDIALRSRVPTGFTFELCDRSVRAVRQDRLVMQYEPVCNRQPDRGRYGRSAHP